MVVVGDLVKPGENGPRAYFHFLRPISKYLVLWFGASLELSPKEFSTIYGSQSSRSGAASATSNAGVPMELWGKHGDWKSLRSQKNYTKRDSEAILSVSRAAMTHVPVSIFGAPFPAPPMPPVAF